ncbi:hypothetical protein BDV29DRAFT_199194 [Aspergillus leporis]|uniref:Tat pathway signal sequence n=1 Tax=Aspergillus leporis TaxID=41062 RepID=A0A5N5XCH1_9EURO|nr:hypothetical protein BDV29DRAFT_199194 [Aspergillus leporis]
MSRLDQVPLGEDNDSHHSNTRKDLEKPLLTNWDSNNDYSPTISDLDLRESPRRWPRLRAPIVWLTVVNIVIFLASIFFLISPLSSQICLNHLSDQDKWRSTSNYAPLFDRFDIPKTIQTPNGSLYDTYPPSILRIPKGDEADKEWFRIGTGVMPIIITSDEIRNLGKDPSVAVKIPEEHGYGNDAYIAQTEVFHLLHCIDMLRKEISYEYYYFPKFGNNPDAQHVAHIGHCIDILAQSIKCSSSVDVILFNWVEGWDQPFPDFANQHVCRDFEALLEYVNENSVPRPVWKTMKEPPAGYVRLPEPAPAKVPGVDQE